MEELEKKMDGLVYALTSNFYTLAKEDKEMYLFNFNRKDSRHWSAIHVASIVRDVLGLRLYVNCSLIDYLWIKWKFKGIKKIKRTKKANIDIEQELSNLEKANEAKGIFSDIYRYNYHYTDRK